MTIFDHILKIVAAVPRVTMFELGACDGYHTRKLAEIAGDKLDLLMAFEAAPYNWPKFGELPKNVRLYQGAVAAVTGRCNLWLSSGESYYGSSSIREPTRHTNYWPDCKFEEQVEVDCITLDDAATSNNVESVDFIWCDIQGGERDAIAGGRDILRRTKFFYTEVSNHELYEGQLLRSEFVSFLSDHTGRKWVEEFDFGGDVLFRNTEPYGTT